MPAAKPLRIISSGADRTARTLTFRLFLVGLLLLALGLLAIWLLDQTPSAPPAEPAAAAAAAAATAAATAAGATPLEPAAEAPQRQELVPAEPAAATFTGRCVDAEARPFPACRVELRALQGESGAAPASQETGSDGRFRLAVPYAGEQFELRVRGPGCCEVGRVFVHQQAGATQDVGDVVLVPGCELRGQVVGGNGAVLADAAVVVQQQFLSLAWFQPAPWVQARTDAAGRFTVVVPAMDGRLQFGVGGFDRVMPMVLRIGAGMRSAEVRLEATRSPVVASISGRVRTGSGLPVVGASVRASTQAGYHVASSRSGADGAFELGLRNEGLLAEPVRLSARHPSGEPGELAAVAWNTTGVDLVLGRGTTALLALRCDGRALTEASLTISIPQGAPALRLQGPFAEGLVPLPSLAPGRYQVLVAPAPATGAAVCRTDFDLAGGASGPVVIEVPRRRQRELQVRQVGGEPVAGARFELLEPGSEPFSIATEAVAPEHWSGSYRGAALLVQAGSCDREGRALLQGRPGAGLALRIRKEGFVVGLVAELSLETAEPLMVELRRGGTLHGTLLPSACADGFRRYAGLQGGQETAAGRGPGIRLVPEGRTPILPPPSEQAVPLDGEGAFVVRGVPPGSWSVVLECPARPGAGGFLQETLGSVAFLGDEVLRVTFDASSLLPAALAGTVAIDGEPRSGAVLQLQVEHSSRSPRQFEARSRADGSFELLALPGNWTIHVAVAGGGAGGFHQYRWPETLELAPGERRAADLVFARSSLRLRCLTGAGLPVAGLLLQLRTPAGLVRCTTPPTDAEGRTSLPELEAGPFLLFALPRSLQDPAAFRTWLAAHPGEGVEGVLVRVGEVVLAAGGAGEQELRLPKAWER